GDGEAIRCALAITASARRCVPSPLPWPIRRCNTRRALAVIASLDQQLRPVSQPITCRLGPSEGAGGSDAERRPGL
ncbi:MAG: hypothetical protein ACK5PF_10885, partial [bacterium]